MGYYRCKRCGAETARILTSKWIIKEVEIVPTDDVFCPICDQCFKVFNKFFCGASKRGKT